MYFVNEFRDFSKCDKITYSGAETLPNGDSPKICDKILLNGGEISYDVVVIVSGSGDDNTSINIITENGYWCKIIPGCNRCHGAIADAIVDEFRDFENVSDAIESIILDFEMESCYEE